MPKFLIQANYTPEGLKGVLKEGGTGRQNTAEQEMAGFGGNVVPFYFVVDDIDAFCIADASVNVTAAAVVMAVNASLLVSSRTTPLLTPEEVDQATKKSVPVRGAGQYLSLACVGRSSSSWSV